MNRFMDELMNELINYGGIAAPRHAVYAHALAAVLSRGADDKTAVKCAEMFAFGPRTIVLSAADAAKLIPWTSDPELKGD